MLLIEYVNESESIQNFFLFCCLGYSTHCEYRNQWPRGLIIFKIRVIICKDDVTVQTQIVLYSFKTKYPRYFLADPHNIMEIKSIRWVYYVVYWELDFCLTVHHQLGKVI